MLYAIGVPVQVNWSCLPIVMVTILIVLISRHILDFVGMSLLIISPTVFLTAMQQWEKFFILHVSIKLNHPPINAFSHSLKPSLAYKWTSNLCLQFHSIKSKVKGKWAPKQLLSLAFFWLLSFISLPRWQPEIWLRLRRSRLLVRINFRLWIYWKPSINTALIYSSVCFVSHLNEQRNIIKSKEKEYIFFLKR